MKRALMILSLCAFGAMENGWAQKETRRLIGEERAQKLAVNKVGAGRVEFTERKVKAAKTVYEVYVMQGDTLCKVTVDGYTSAIDALIVDPMTGRDRLQARVLSQKRAALAAKAVVSGVILRWRLRYESEKWFYRFQIETPKGQIKEVYVNEYDFKVTRIKMVHALDTDMANISASPQPN